MLRRANPHIGFAFSVVGMFLSGCAGMTRDSGLGDIDRRTLALLRESANRLTAGSIGEAGSAGDEAKDQIGIAPQRNYPLPTGLDDRRLRQPQPQTTNPSASQLKFSAADEARDVSKRLTEYQQQTFDPRQSPSATQVAELDLFGALKQAQQTAREHINAEEDYILAAIRLLIEEHRWSPRLFDDVSASYANTQIDGSSTQNVIRIMNELGVRQRLPFGGEAAARWIWEASEDMRSSVTGRYVQSSRLVFEGNVPLLRGAGDFAREDLIQSERNLVYAARSFEDFRRTFFVQIARDYFNLLLQLDSIASQERQLESLRQLEDRQREWYKAGKVAEFEVNLARNNVLSAEASLANLREQYILALDAFKIRLGMGVTAPVKVLPSELPIPEPDITLEEAARRALEYRLDLANRRDQVDDSQRAVRNAQNQLLPDLNLGASLTLPTDADEREGGVVYEPDDVSYEASVTFGLPLDREIERLQMRQAIIGLQRSQRDLDQFIDQIVLEVRGRVREIERARLNLQLAEERVKITLRRQEEQKIKEDEIDTQAKVDTANDLLQAERARDQARTDVRNAVLDYLVSTGQLRVRRDGTFEPLAGMKLINQNPPTNEQKQNNPAQTP